MGFTRLKVKTLLNIVLLLLITDAQTSSVGQYSNLLSSLYKQASSQDRPIIVVIDSNSNRNNERGRLSQNRDDESFFVDRANNFDNNDEITAKNIHVRKPTNSQNRKPRYDDRNENPKERDYSNRNNRYNNENRLNRNEDRNNRNNNRYNNAFNNYRHGSINDRYDDAGPRDEERNSRYEDRNENRNSKHFYSNRGHDYNNQNDRYNDNIDVDRNNRYSKNVDEAYSYDRNHARNDRLRDRHGRNYRLRGNGYRNNDRNNRYDQESQGFFDKHYKSGDRDYRNDKYRNSYDKNGNENKQISRTRDDNDAKEIKQLENSILKSPLVKTILKLSDDYALRKRDSCAESGDDDSCEEKKVEEATDDPCDSRHSCEEEDNDNISTRGMVDNYVSDPPPKVCDEKSCH